MGCVLLLGRGLVLVRGVVACRAVGGGLRSGATLIDVQPRRRASSACEDTPCRHHATTTPYDPSPPRRTTTHVTTQLKTLRSPIALYSQSLNCNLGIFLIFFLIRL